MNDKRSSDKDVKSGTKHLYELIPKLEQYYSPKVVGEVNDAFVKIVKAKGTDIPWHTHDNEDEMFLILKGELSMQIDGGETEQLKAGDLYIVPRGVRHRVECSEECWLVLVEPKATLHTGDVQSRITKSIEDQL